jgi:hypothetical protein
VAETPDEAEILARAHAALRRGDAAAALVLTLEHEHAFPAGLLAQERDAIAIEGLVAVGRVEDAQARLRSFAARFPQSGYLWRLGTLVERNAGP